MSSERSNLKIRPRIETCNGVSPCFVLLLVLHDVRNEVTNLDDKEFLNFKLSVYHNHQFCDILEQSSS
jgi:hypothetical protein